MDGKGGNRRELSRQIGERIRTTFQRGNILTALRAEFTREKTPAAVLFHTVASLVAGLTRNEFDDHLTYLEGKEYIRLWHQRDMEEERDDRQPSDRDVRSDDIRFARLLPKGVDLLEGSIPADPGIDFE